MRQTMIASLVLAGLAACGPQESRPGSVARAIEDAANPGALWPVMLAHCLRAQSCDPMSDFGQGSGQASGVAGEVSYFAESPVAASESGGDQAATVTLSLYGTRGRGGEAGRPMTLDETASDLRVAKARRSTLSIEYRKAGQAAPEPHAFHFASAQIALAAATSGEIRTRNDLTRAAEAHVNAMRWPDGGEGARIEFVGTSGVVLTGYSKGRAADDFLDAKAALRRGFEPWVFHLHGNLREDPARALMAAIEAGETLSLSIVAPDGGIMLKDAIYTAGYAEALREARKALADPELSRTIPERCARFAAKRDDFWRVADVTPALRVCDPRTAEQRRLASAPAAPVPVR